MPNCITGRAPRLSGSGYIEYVIKNNDDRGLYLQITGNKKDDGSDAGGTFTREPIYLCDLIGSIVRVSSDGGCFKSEDLRPVIPRNNENDPAFVVAILKGVRFVEESAHQDQYRFRCGGG